MFNLEELLVANLIMLLSVRSKGRHRKMLSLQHRTDTEQYSDEMVLGVFGST